MWEVSTRKREIRGERAEMNTHRGGQGGVLEWCARVVRVFLGARANTSLACGGHGGVGRAAVVTRWGLSLGLVGVVCVWRTGCGVARVGT